MQTASVQNTRLKDLVLGLFLGAGSEVIIGVLSSFLFTYLIDKIWDAVYNNGNLMFLLNISIDLGFFIVLLIAVHYKLKNKFVTIGMASGFVATKIFMGLVFSQILK